MLLKPVLTLGQFGCRLNLNEYLVIAVKFIMVKDFVLDDGLGFRLTIFDVVVGRTVCGINMTATTTTTTTKTTITITTIVVV